MIRIKGIGFSCSCLNTNVAEPNPRAEEPESEIK